MFFSCRKLSLRHQKQVRELSSVGIVAAVVSVVSPFILKKQMVPCVAVLIFLMWLSGER